MPLAWQTPPLRYALYPRNDELFAFILVIPSEAWESILLC